MTERIKEVLEETPPELHGDIIQDGIIMTGGGSLIYGLDKRISDDIGVKVVLAPDIIDCVAKGAGIALDNIDTDYRADSYIPQKSIHQRLKKRGYINYEKRTNHTNKRRNPKNSSAPLSVFAYRQNC